MTFFDVFLYVFDNEDYMREYRRLNKTNFGLAPRQRSGIEAMVDKATGFDPYALNEEDALTFIHHVYEVVWSRLPPECFTTEPEAGK